jgi:mRNA interferase MazF
VNRGDIFALPSPRAPLGHEQRESRYAVVLQADALLSLSTWIVAPTSTRARPASFRPEISLRGRKTRVLVEQMGAIAPERLGNQVGHLRRDELIAVESAARAVLDL